MKLSSLIPCLTLVLAVGCTEVRHQASSSSSTHLTESQAIALAQPKLPLPAGESYRTAFKAGVWEVWTDRANSQHRSWTVVTIRDSDGEVLGVAHRF